MPSALSARTAHRVLLSTYCVGGKAESAYPQGGGLIEISSVMRLHFSLTSVNRHPYASLVKQRLSSDLRAQGRTTS